MATPAVDPAPQPLRVGDEQVVADQLALVRRAARSAASSRPSPPRPSRPRSRRSGTGRRSRPSSRPSPRGSALGPRARARSAPSLSRTISLVAGSRAMRRRPPGLVAGRLDRLRRARSSAASFDSRSGAKPPSSPTVVDRPRSESVRFSACEDLGPHPQRLGEARGAGGNDHELLEVDRVVGVGAAVDHVHHRHRQDVGLLAARPVELREVEVERHPGLGRRRPRDRQRDAENRVRPEPRLVRRPVELAQRLVDRDLVGRPGAGQRLGDRPR